MEEISSEISEIRLRGPYLGGRHLYMAKGAFKVRIPNPHRSDISRALVFKIMKQAGISFDEWDKA